MTSESLVDDSAACSDTDTFKPQPQPLPTFASLEDEVLFLRQENALLRGELQVVKDQIWDVTQVCDAVVHGGFKKRIRLSIEPTNFQSEKEMQKLAVSVNSMVNILEDFTREIIEGCRQATGNAEPLGGTLPLSPPVWSTLGTWKEVITAVNQLASTHTMVIRSVAEVTKAVAMGDLSHTMDMDLRGEAREMKHIVNGMVFNLRTIVSDLIQTSVASANGILDIQIEPQQANGVWAALARNVNHLFKIIAGLVRSISLVATSIDRGDLTQKMDIDAQGELASLQCTINSMVDLLSGFVSEVERVTSGAEG